MQIVGEQTKLSASDLANHSACRHLTNLDLALAEGKIKAPRPADADDDLDELIEKGVRHERDYIKRLREESPGVSVLMLGDEAAPADTAAAMTAVRTRIARERIA